MGDVVIKVFGAVCGEDERLSPSTATVIDTVCACGQLLSTPVFDSFLLLI